MSAKNKTSEMTLEERKCIYAQRQKERTDKARKDAKKCKREGRASERTMYFFEHIVKSLNLTWVEVADAAGISQQAISSMMIYDDAKLSRVKQILASLGIVITPEFDTDEDTAEKVASSGPCFEIIGDIPSRHKTLDPVVRKALDEPDSNLYFLARFMEDEGITLPSLAEMSGNTLAKMKNAFKVDNIRISAIYQIAVAYDRKILWKLKKLDSPDLEQGGC